MTTTTTPSRLSWGRARAWLQSLSPTGWHRHVLAYAALAEALPLGLLPGALFALLLRGCDSLECVGIGTIAFALGFLGVLPLLVSWARRLHLGVWWALLTMAGLTVLSATPLVNWTEVERLPMIIVAGVALPAATAWATTPDRAWWVRLARVGAVAAGVAAVITLYRT